MGDGGRFYDIWCLIWCVFLKLVFWGLEICGCWGVCLCVFV